jgi:hypothetical protein
MPVTEKVIAGGHAAATVLSTELNALANGSYTAQGTLLDNTTIVDRLARAELLVTFGSSPTAGAICDLYMVVSLDGTNYPDGSATKIPPGATKVGSFQVNATTDAQRIHTAPFQLGGPYKHKFLLRNRSGQAFPASGSTVTVTSHNRQSVSS